MELDLFVSWYLVGPIAEPHNSHAFRPLVCNGHSALPGSHYPRHGADIRTVLFT